MKKTIIAFMALATIILASCGNPMITDIEDETVVIEIPSFKSVEEGDYDSLYSEVSVLSFETQEFLKGEEPSYTWESDNDSIATVDANGIVTPHQGGTVTISIKMNGSIIATSDPLTFNDVRLIGNWTDFSVITATYVFNEGTGSKTTTVPITKVANFNWSTENNVLTISNSTSSTFSDGTYTYEMNNGKLAISVYP